MTLRQKTSNAKPAHASSKKRILIVDDCASDRSIIRAAIQRNENFQIFEADGADACFQALQNQPMDMILLDILMPGKSGLEVLRQIRQKANATELPIILITEAENESDFVTGLGLGANDYLSKPILTLVAESRIKTHLELADLKRKMSTLRELEVRNATIKIYNHELNNPLAVALGYLESGRLNRPDQQEILRKALWRMADVIKKISALIADKPSHGLDKTHNNTRDSNLAKPPL